MTEDFYQIPSFRSFRRRCVSGSSLLMGKAFLNVLSHVQRISGEFSWQGLGISALVYFVFIPLSKVCKCLYSIVDSSAATMEPHPAPSPDLQSLQGLLDHDPTPKPLPPNLLLTTKTTLFVRPSIMPTISPQSTSHPQVKEESISVTIPKDEYQVRLDSWKNHLHG